MLLRKCIISNGMHTAPEHTAHKLNRTAAGYPTHPIPYQQILQYLLCLRRSVHEILNIL